MIIISVLLPLFFAPGDSIRFKSNTYIFTAARGQVQCIRKEGYKTKEYTEIEKENSANNIDMCENECIKVLLFDTYSTGREFDILLLVTL